MVLLLSFLILNYNCFAINQTMRNTFGFYGNIHNVYVCNRYVFYHVISDT